MRRGSGTGKSNLSPERRCILAPCFNFLPLIGRDFKSIILNQFFFSLESASFCAPVILSLVSFLRFVLFVFSFDHYFIYLQD